MKYPLNIHRAFLEAVRKDNTPVVVYLVNGVKLEGEIDAYDDIVIILRRGPANYPDSDQLAASVQKRMIFRHAVSTIFPLGPVRFVSHMSRDQHSVAENRTGNSNAQPARRHHALRNSKKKYDRMPESDTKGNTDDYLPGNYGEEEHSESNS